MTGDTPWWKEVEAAGIEAAVRATGLRLSRDRFGPCPHCGADRTSKGRGDKRPPCTFGKRAGSGWKCMSCGQGGGPFEIVAHVVTGQLRYTDMSPDDRATLRTWCAREGLCSPDDGSPRRPPPVPPPSEVPEVSYPPEDEVRALWEASGPLADDPEAAVWAQRFDPPGWPPCAEPLTECDVVRVIPKGCPLPEWAAFGARSWAGLGYRAIVPLFDATGALRSLRARSIQPARPDLGSVPKEITPRGFQVGGLTMADARARDILAGRAPEGVFPSLVIAEGVPDFLTHCLLQRLLATNRLGVHSRDLGRVHGVIGIFSGAWTPEHAARVPPRTLVAVRPHRDDTGRKYAREVIASLMERPPTKACSAVVRAAPEEGDDNDALRAGRIAELLPPETGYLRGDPRGHLVGGTFAERTDLDATFAGCTEFPIEVLPEWGRHMVEWVAHDTQTPVSIAGTLFLSICGLAVAKRTRIAAKSSWTEPLNLYSLSIADPGQGKSPCFNALLRPVQDFEWKQRSAEAGRLADAQAKVEMLNGKIAGIKRELTGKNLSDVERRVLQADLSRALEDLNALPPAEPTRLTVDDATTEKVAQIMASQQGRIGVISPEGDIFDTISGRYGTKPNLALWKKGWSDAVVAVDRISRSSLHIPFPAISIALSTQVSVLKELAQTPQFRSQGFLARFLFAFPDDTVGHRIWQGIHPIPETVVDTYNWHVQSLLNLPMDVGADHWREWRCIVIPPDLAEKHVTRLREELEPRMAKFRDLEHVRDWAAKMGSHLMRIAGILHMAAYTHEPEPWRIPIEEDTLIRARQLADFYLGQARKAFGVMETPPDLDRAQRLLDYVQKHELDLVPWRDVWKSVKKRGDSQETWEAAREALVLSGAIEVQSHSPAGGGPAKQIIARNPLPTHERAEESGRRAAEG